ncbi:MAG: hypothetical protein LUD51_07990 [Clostridia bacterium]|nr:hypothetical protein [Clostridia bacterium]
MRKLARWLRNLLIVVIVIVCIVVVLGIFLLVWFYADSYKDLESFNTEFAIPGLEDGVVPQGLGSYTDADGNATFFMCCYMVDGSASRIYVINEGSGTESYVTLKTASGSDFSGHCGGIASDGTHVWLSSEMDIYTMDYDTLVSSASATGGTMNIGTGFVVDAADEGDGKVFNVAYLFYDAEDGALYAGEFYRPGNYPTIDEHQITTPAGDENTAIVYKLDMDETDAKGFKSIPSCAYSTPSQIQGFAISNGKVALSESYGLANSYIYVYDLAKANAGEKDTLDLLTADSTTVQLDLYYLDSSSLDTTYILPSMTEGLTVSNGKVYVLFESAGKKYRMYVRERMYNVISVSL